VNCGTKHGNEH